MSTSFDPYHKWLGIPPDQQPAHHYRLLGIGLFESDADVIEAAANQRTAYLQELAAGEQVELTQKLLNEITQARRCLLNPEQKQAYDARLQAQQPASPAGLSKLDGVSAQGPVGHVGHVQGSGGPGLEARGTPAADRVVDHIGAAKRLDLCAQVGGFHVEQVVGAGLFRDLQPRRAAGAGDRGRDCRRLPAASGSCARLRSA